MNICVVRNFREDSNMKRLAPLAIATLLLASSWVVLSADPPDRPAGVAAASWVPVSDRLGIVLEEPAAPMTGARDVVEVREGSLRGRTVKLDPDGGSRFAAPTGQALFLKPPVGGYFMVKGAGGWTRLVIYEPVKGPGDAG
jgi:hypothetical protein